MVGSFREHDVNFHWKISERIERGREQFVFLIEEGKMESQSGVLKLEGEGCTLNLKAYTICEISLKITV